MSDGSGCDAELLSRIRAMDVPGNLRARALRVKCEHDEVQRFREYVRGNLYVQADELIEVTPTAIRLRKAELNSSMRKSNARKAAKSAD